MHIQRDAPQHRGTGPQPIDGGKGINVVPELLTVGDFLSRYSISRSGFYREVNRGAIPLVKLGTATRIARADAEAWLASLPVKQGGEAHG